MFKFHTFLILLTLWHMQTKAAAQHSVVPTQNLPLLTSNATATTLHHQQKQQYQQHHHHHHHAHNHNTHHHQGDRAYNDTPNNSERTLTFSMPISAKEAGSSLSPSSSSSSSSSFSASSPTSFSAYPTSSSSIYKSDNEFLIKNSLKDKQDVVLNNHDESAAAVQQDKLENSKNMPQTTTKPSIKLDDIVLNGSAMANNNNNSATSTTHQTVARLKDNAQQQNNKLHATPLPLPLPPPSLRNAGKQNKNQKSQSQSKQHHHQHHQQHHNLHSKQHLNTYNNNNDHEYEYEDDNYLAAQAATNINYDKYNQGSDNDNVDYDSAADATKSFANNWSQSKFSSKPLALDHHNKNNKINNNYQHIPKKGSSHKYTRKDFKEYYDEMSDYYDDAANADITDSNDDYDYNVDRSNDDYEAGDNSNNLSDREYNRITRSKVDHDYAEDEPYRNMVDDGSEDDDDASENGQMQRDAASTAPGVITEQKYLEVGNEKAVQQARERYLMEQRKPRTPQELAKDHYLRMIPLTRCRSPLPRVIRVSNNTSKRYEPLATILHRCGEDSGCCTTTAQVCTVRKTEIVNIYVVSVDIKNRKEVEVLPMSNHTECHCAYRTGLSQTQTMLRGKRSGALYHSNYFSQNQKQQQLQQPWQRSDLNNYRMPSQQQQQHQHMDHSMSCHCPRHFTAFEEDVVRQAHLPRPHIVATRKCHCDCVQNNQTCLRFKNGEEGFSLEDRKCILDYNCKHPTCSHGEYNMQMGRCPSPGYRTHSQYSKPMQRNDLD